VRDELACLPKAQERLSVAAQAISIARAMDNPEMQAGLATLSRQLQSLMTELQAQRKKSRGRLHVVSKMSAPQQDRRRAQ
jgi:hypothetical protein